MKKTVLLSLFLAIFLNVWSQDKHSEMIVEGNYWEKNLYIYNPGEVQNSCVKAILINNRTIDSVFNSNSIIVDLKSLKFESGDNLVLLIQHDEDCQPIISNPDAIRPSCELYLEDFKHIRRQGIIQWNNEEFDKNKILELEQYLWGKWVNVYNIGNSDTAKINSFIPVLVSRLNLFRIKQYDPTTKNITYTKSIRVRTGNRNIVLERRRRIGEKINFNDKTHYEIYDSEGKLLLGGVDKEVDISHLPKGEYWLNYDINTEYISKK